MATSQETVKRILASCEGLTARPMFGEYGLYYDEKIIGSVNDDQLFLKITPPGRAALDESYDAPPYPGAKPALRIPPDRWEDHAWLSDLIKATAAALPRKTKKNSAK